MCQCGSVVGTSNKPLMQSSTEISHGRCVIANLCLVVISISASVTLSLLLILLLLLILQSLLVLPLY